MTEALQNPLVLFLFGMAAQTIGGIAKEFALGAMGRVGKVEDKSGGLAERVASIESTMKHVSMDQEAHTKQAELLSNLRVEVAEIKAEVKTTLRIVAQALQVALKRAA